MPRAPSVAAMPPPGRGADHRAASISLRIEELALGSSWAGSERRIADALRSGLATRLCRGGTPPAWSAGGAVTRLASSIRMRAGATPQAIGEELARALWAARVEERR
ncbi:MAG TPA: hypothetical protein VI356_00670 [Myxococcales bacterium]